VVLLSVLPLLFFFVLYNTHNTNIHALSGSRTRNPSKRSAANLCLRPLGQTELLLQAGLYMHMPHRTMHCGHPARTPAHTTRNKDFCEGGRCGFFRNVVISYQTARCRVPHGCSSFVHICILNSTDIRVVYRLGEGI
jgi:hypothetical protein